MRASDYRRQARDNLSGKWGLAVGTTFVAILLGGIYGVGSSGSSSFDEQDLQTVFGDLSTEQLLFWVKLFTIFMIISATFSFAGFILGGATKAGLCAFNRHIFKGEKAEFNDLFSHYDIFGKAFLTNLLIGIFTTLWTLLFIIPGIIAAYAYSMTFYILDENPEMDAMDAIRESRRIMKGHKWKFFVLELTFIGWILLSIFSLGIGMIFIYPYMEQAKYAFYYNIAHGEDNPYGEVPEEPIYLNAAE